MYRRQSSSAAAVVRLPPLPRRPRTNMSVTSDTSDSPWGLDNPALRQLSTNTGGSRQLRNRSRTTRRSFRSSKISLPEINGRKSRQTGSARSMRSNISMLSQATIKSTRSLDMFRYNLAGTHEPSGFSNTQPLHGPTLNHNRKWRSGPGSTISINSSVSTIPLPPIEGTMYRDDSTEDSSSPAALDEDDDEDDEDASSVWPGSEYASDVTAQCDVNDVDSNFQPSIVGDDSRSLYQPSIPEERAESASARPRPDPRPPPPGGASKLPLPVPKAKLADDAGAEGDVILDQRHARPPGYDGPAVGGAERPDVGRTPRTPPDGERLEGITVRGTDAPPEEADAETPGAGGEASREEEEEWRVRALPPAEQVNRVFLGDFRFLPPMMRTSVRIFFWASPKGFHVEREWIASRCLGVLQTQIAQRGLDLQLVDLHLDGYDLVPRDTLDEILRDQLDACQRLSVGPAVLAFISGDDFRRSLPVTMTPAHFEALCEIADRKQLPHRELLTAHFRPVRTGSNASVVEYQLQTRDPDADLADADPADADPADTDPVDADPARQGALLSRWPMTAGRLRELLRRTLVTAVVEQKVTQKQAKVYLQSEAPASPVRAPDTDPGEQVRQTVGSYPARTLCYIRQHLEESQTTPQSVSRAPSAPGSQGSSGSRGSPGKPSKGSVLLTSHLSVDIRKKLNFLAFPLPALGSCGRVYNLQPLRDAEAEPANLSQQQRAYLTRLCDDVLGDVIGAVEAAPGKTELEVRWHSTALHREVLHHARLCTMRQAAFRGPRVFLDEVKEYLLNANYAMVPLIISARADKNKSQLMASVGRLVRQWLEPECAVIVRFLGTSPDSRDIKRVLLGIIYQIGFAYDMIMPSMEEVDNFDAAVTCFNALLASVSMKHGHMRPLVLLLDSLENATSTEGNHTAAWVPQLCPPNIHLIISVASGSRALLDVLRGKLLEDMCFLSLDKSVDPPQPPAPAYSLKQTGSGCVEAQSSVRSSAGTNTGTSLDDSEEEEEEESSAEESRLAELVTRRLDTLEQRHGEVVMTWLLCYLSVCEGLTEVELLDALSCNEDVIEEVFIGSDVALVNRKRFPQKLWALIQRDIGRFLEERFVDNKMVFGIGDEQVAETIRSRYLKRGRLGECHMQLAGLLHDGASGGNVYDDTGDELVVQRQVAPQPLVVNNHRKLSRLPALLYGSQPFVAIRDDFKSQMLCSFTWLLTKLKAFGFYHFIEDFHMIRESDDDIEFVRDLLMLCKPVIEKDPNQLSAEIMARLGPQTCSERPYLQQLRVGAATWCADSAIGTYAVPKFQYLPCPSGHLRRTIHGPWHILGMCGDGLMVVWGKVSGLQVWDAAVNACMHHLCNPYTWEDTLLSADGRFLYQAVDTNLVGWNVQTAEKICQIDILPNVSATGRKQNPQMDDSFLTPMAISDDRMFAVVRVNKPEMLLEGKGVAVLDLSRQLVVHTAIEAMGDQVSNCRFTSDSNRLIVTETQVMPGQRSEVHIFDCLTMETMGKQLVDERFTIVPDTLHLSRDESKLIVGCRPDNFLVFAVSDCSPLFVPPSPPGEELSRFVDMKVLPTDHVVLLSMDITQAAVLRVSNLDGMLRGPILTSNTGGPKFVEVSAMQSLAFVGFLDVGAVDIWDLERSFLLYTLTTHLGHITSCVLSPGGQTLYTGGTDGTIRVWKFANMLIAKGRSIRSARIAQRASPSMDATQQRALSEALVSLTDADDIRESDGGESLVDSNDEVMDVDMEADDVDMEVDEAEKGPRSYPASQTATDDRFKNAEVDGDAADENSSDSECKSHQADMEGNAKAPNVADSRAKSTSSCCFTQRPKSYSSSNGVRGSAQGSVRGSVKGSATSGLGSAVGKTSAGSRRQNSSVPSWAMGSSYLSHTIKEDEMTPDAADIDIHPPISGQRPATRGSHTPCSPISHHSSVPKQRAGELDPSNDVSIDHLEDTKMKLAEIFRRLDEQALEEAGGVPQEEAGRDQELRTTLMGTHGQVLEEAGLEMEDVNMFVETEDGQSIVTSHRKGAPVLWSLDRGEITHRMETPWDTGATVELALDADCKRIFGLSRLGFEQANTSGYENCLRVWDLQTGVCEPMPADPLYADAFALTPDKRKLLLLTRRADGRTGFSVLETVGLQRLLVGEVDVTLSTPFVHVTCDARYAITCHPGVSVVVWHLLERDDTGVSRHTTLPVPTIPPAMQLVDAERTLLVGTGFGSVLALPLEGVASLPHAPNPALRLVPERHQGETLCLQLSRDNALLLTSASDHVVRVIDRVARRTLHELRGHTDLITCMQVSRDNALVVSGCHDTTTRLWSVRTGDLVGCFVAHHDVFRVAFSADSRTLAVLVDHRARRALVLLDLVTCAVKSRDRREKGDVTGHGDAARDAGKVDGRGESGSGGGSVGRRGTAGYQEDTAGYQEGTGYQETAGYQEATRAVSMTTSTVMC